MNCTKCNRVLGRDDGRGLCPRCWAEKNRNELREIFDCGRLRQILERGDLSGTEIDMVINAVSEKYKF